jgi:hypothetical protein
LIIYIYAYRSQGKHWIRQVRNDSFFNTIGDGHFSPVGGFNESNRMVLIMDVARFKYPAYWVSIDLLWESLHPKDESTNKSRGR